MHSPIADSQKSKKVTSCRHFPALLSCLPLCRRPHVHWVFLTDQQPNRMPRSLYQDLLPHASHRLRLLLYEMDQVDKVECAYWHVCIRSMRSRNLRRHNYCYYLYHVFKCSSHALGTIIRRWHWWTLGGRTRGKAICSSASSGVYTHQSNNDKDYGGIRYFYLVCSQFVTRSMSLGANANRLDWYT